MLYAQENQGAYGVDRSFLLAMSLDRHLSLRGLLGHPKYAYEDLILTPFSHCGIVVPAVRDELRRNYRHGPWLALEARLHASGDSAVNH